MLDAPCLGIWLNADKTQYNVLPGHPVTEKLLKILRAVKAEDTTYEARYCKKCGWLIGLVVGQAELVVAIRKGVA
jgi:hypothetical protein